MASRAALAATRSLDILDYLAANPSQGHTLTELARNLGVNASSMHSILAVMADAGYVVRHPVHKTYRLGPVAAAVGQAAVLQDPIIELAVDEVARLTHDFDMESVVLTSVGEEMVVVARSGPPTGRFLSFIGQRWKHEPPMGSVFVAWADDDARERWLGAARPPLDAAGRRNYEQVLAQVRADGRSVVVVDEKQWKLATDREARASTSRSQGLITTLDPSKTYRVFYIGFPVFNAFGEVVVGLFVNGPSARLTVERINEVVQRLGDAASRVISRSGGRPPAGRDGPPRADR
jgi:DNA-binding IclR family transcriptional regulator